MFHTCLIFVISSVITLSGNLIMADKGSEPRVPEASVASHSTEATGEKRKLTEEQNIFYGGILQDFSPDVQSNDTDIQDIVKFALNYAAERHCKTVPRNDKDVPLKPDVFHPRKMKLQYTIDGKTAFIFHEESYASGHRQIQRKKAIVGIDYYITLTWTEVPASYQHNFIIRKDRKHQLHLHGHTFYRPTKNIFKIPPESYKFNKVSDISHAVPVFVPIVSEQMTSQSQSCEGHMTTGECSEARENIWKDSTQNKVHSTETEGGETAALNETVKLVTYNIWNFNSVLKHNTKKHYNSRITRLGEFVSSSSADIIGYQEVRFDATENTELGPSQATHLAKHLPKYQFVFQPAMTQSNMGQEGLALFSIHPILSHDFITLPRNESDEGDSHQRICLHAEIETPHIGLLHVYVTHLSLSQKARERSVVEIWKYMSKHSGPAVLMGDLNAQPDSPEYKFLKGEVELHGMKTSELVDAWTVFHPEPRPDAPRVYKDDEERDYGLTFSALNEHLSSRIDFIFVKLPDDIKLTNVSTLDNGRRATMAPSDHIGLQASLKHTSSK